MDHYLKFACIALLACMQVQLYLMRVRSRNRRGRGRAGRRRKWVRPIIRGRRQLGDSLQPNEAVASVPTITSDNIQCGFQLSNTVASFTDSTSTSSSTSENLLDSEAVSTADEDNFSPPRKQRKRRLTIRERAAASVLRTQTADSRVREEDSGVKSIQQSLSDLISATSTLVEQLKQSSSRDNSCFMGTFSLAMDKVPAEKKVKYTVDMLNVAQAYADGKTVNIDIQE